MTSPLQAMRMTVLHNGPTLSKEYVLRLIDAACAAPESAKAIERSKAEHFTASRAQFEANILGAAMRRIAENDTHGMTPQAYADQALEVSASWMRDDEEKQPARREPDPMAGLRGMGADAARALIDECAWLAGLRNASPDDTFSATAWNLLIRVANAAHKAGGAERDAALSARAAVSAAPLHGFSRDSLEDVASGLESEPPTINVGAARGIDEGDVHIESGSAYIARFIRTALAADPHRDTARLDVLDKTVKEGSIRFDDHTFKTARVWAITAAPSLSLREAIDAFSAAQSQQVKP